MNLLNTLLIIGASALITSCSDLSGSNTTANAPTTVIIPKMVPRTSTVGLPGEYEKLQATYAHLKEELKKHPGDLKNMLKLSEVFITESRITGNYGPNQAAALHILDDVIAKSAGTDAGMKEIQGQALTLKALIKLSQHQFSEARELGEKAVQLDPYKALNYGVLVDANVELGDYKKAVVMSDKMVGMRPDLQSYGRVSYLREIHGDIPGAIEAMQMAVKAGYPGSDETSWCMVQLGGLHERNNNLKEAARAYEQTLIERPGYPFALAAAGRVAGKNKDHETAETKLKQAIATMPDAHFYTDLARVYKVQGKTTEYAEAIRLAEETLIGLGGEHAHDANVEHQHANAHGHSHQVGLEMARFELEFHHDLPNAMKNAEHEFEHRENNIEVNMIMASILLEQGDLGAASTHLALAKATGSQNAELKLIEGVLLSKKGDVSAGKKLIASAMEQDPYLSNPLTEQALAL